MPLIEAKLPKDWRLEWAQQKAALEKDTVTFSVIRILGSGTGNPGECRPVR